jgi:hypothetical protein
VGVAGDIYQGTAIFQILRLLCTAWKHRETCTPSSSVIPARAFAFKALAFASGTLMRHAMLPESFLQRTNAGPVDRGLVERGWNWGTVV